MRKTCKIETDRFFEKIDKDELIALKRESIGLFFMILSLSGIAGILWGNNIYGLASIKNFYRILFGYYGAIPVLGYLGWLGYCFIKETDIKNKPFSRFNAGLLLLLFISLLFPGMMLKDNIQETTYAAGFFGNFFADLIVSNLSPVGAWIYWVFTLILAFYFISGTSFRQIMDKVPSMAHDKRRKDTAANLKMLPKTTGPLHRPIPDEKKRRKIELSTEYFPYDKEDKVAGIKTAPKKFIQETLNLKFKLPPPDILPLEPERRKKNRLNVDQSAKLISTLETFGIRSKIVDVHYGPVITRYDLQPAPGIKVSRIVNLADDIAMALAAKGLRIEAPIPGKAAVGIEVPNSSYELVTFAELLHSPVFQNFSGKLPVVLGKDIAGGIVVTDLVKAPHLLIAGATGSGKSVCINTIICSLLCKCAPKETKFILIDPKVVELSIYNDIPHLLTPVVREAKKAAIVLKWVVKQMEERYHLLAERRTRDIEKYNKLVGPAEQLTYIVVIIDELADLMMVAANDVEDSICRLAQMARAVGIHLVVATQRPSVDVITGLIKANIPSRIAFAVSSQVDSRTILDTVGAEKLLGRGDMLFSPVGSLKPIRMQGALIMENQIESIVQYWRAQQKPQYVEIGLQESIKNDEEEDIDTLFWEALRIVNDYGQASASILQRKLHIGYTRAARLVDQLEAKGIIGGYEGNKPREILKSPAQLKSMLEKNKF